MRSAMPPATMVAAAPTNTAWNSQNAYSGTPGADSAPIRNQPVVPNSGLPEPNMIA